MMVKTSPFGSVAIVGIIVAISCTTSAAPFVDQRSLDILFRPDNNTIRAFQNFLKAPIFGIFNGGGPLVKFTRANELHTAIANNNASASDLPNRPGLLSSLGLGSLLGGFGGGFSGGLGGLFGGGSAPATTTARPVTTTTARTTTTTTTRSSTSGSSGSLQLSGRIGGEEGDASVELNVGGELSVGGILSQLGTSLANRVTTTTSEAPDTDVDIKGSFSVSAEDDSNENVAVISLGTSEEDKSPDKSEASSSSIYASVSASKSTTTPSPSDDDDDEEGVTVSISVAPGPDSKESIIMTRLGEESEADKKVGVVSSGYEYTSPAPTTAKAGYQYEKQGNLNFDIGLGFMANSKSNSNGKVDAEIDGGNSIVNLGVNLSGRSSIDDSSSAEDADNEVDKKPSKDGDDNDDDNKDNDDDDYDDRGNRNDGRRNARTDPKYLLSLRVNPQEINNLRHIRASSGIRRLVN